MPAPDPPVQVSRAIEWLDSVGSTNEVAFQRAALGERGPLWIAANRQTGGRGRSGRHWVSPPGNLHASLLVTFPRLLPTVPQLSLVAGLAACQTVQHLAPGLIFRLKWPNDVLMDGAKLAGILIEGRMMPGSNAHNVVIGIGINLAHHPELDARRSTSLAALGVSADPPLALECLAGALEHWLAIWAGGEGLPAVREAWMSRALTAGTAVTVNTGREMIEGQFVGLDPDGSMVLRLADGGQRLITFGDVHIGAPPGADF